MSNLNLGKKLLVLSVALMLFLVWGIVTRDSALADPHSGQSLNVVIIGGAFLNSGCTGSGMAANYMGATGGGCLPVTGPAGELGDFIFTAMDPPLVNAASLAPFDTAVLNMASVAMGCNPNTLSVGQQADLMAFLASGKKLIIYDSECPPVNYSWLPYPFQTSNPGAMGAQGTLTVVEDNLLSTLVGDPACTSGDLHCIDMGIGSSTDAVGDMNVMTTFDPNWCVDLAGTNYLGTTGPVHSYANYPAGTDTGLLIYNGLDQDFQTINEHNLRKLWVQELQHPFAPSGLPCRVTVVGITLAPPSAQNPVGTNHTVTAMLTDLLGNPQAGIQVSFAVLSGPNTGASGTCSVNADCTTDGAGAVSFTYLGSGGVGFDTIEACFFDVNGQRICSQRVSKEWLNQPPDCTNAGPSRHIFWPPNHRFVTVDVVGVTDPDGDPVVITIDSIFQDEPVDTWGDGRFTPDGMGVGTSSAGVRVERSGTAKVPGNGRVYHIAFTATDDKGGACSGVVRVGVPHDMGQHRVPIDDGALFDSTALSP